MLPAELETVLSGIRAARLDDEVAEGESRLNVVYGRGKTIRPRRVKKVLPSVFQIIIGEGANVGFTTV